MARWLVYAGKLIARVMLAVLVIAQLTLSAQACMMPVMARDTAFSSAAMPEGCGSLSKNACLAQWTAADQAVDTLPPTGHLAPAPSPPRPSLLAPVAASERLLPLGLERDSGPPSRIRYCRYLK